MVRLTDRPDMTLDVYRGRKTTTHTHKRQCEVKILNIGTHRSKQTVQTQIRLLKEQSDQDLHCSRFHLHLLDALLHYIHFRTITVIILAVPFLEIVNI